MNKLTYIKGKDASLEDSIEGLQSTLYKLGYHVEETSWLNPVKNVFSLHVKERRCNGLFTNGKGASQKSALASALGEFLERLSTNYFFSDYYLEPVNCGSDWLYYPDEKAFTEQSIQDCLSPELWNFYTENGEIEFTDYLSFNDSSNTVRALPLVNNSTQEATYFPMNLLSNLYASNGLSAGNSALEAQVQGLSEVFERWVKNKVFKENICLPLVPEAVVERFPHILEMVNGMRESGIELSIRDASLGGKFPVISVVLFEQKSGRCFASFGAHPLFEVALERTITESLQGRHLKDLDGFQTPVFDEYAVAEDENIENHFIDSSGLIHARFISTDFDFEFKDWNFSDNTEEQWQALVSSVKAQGFDVFVANYRYCGFDACRIIVPGMSEIYPVSELQESNQNEGRLLRDALLALPETRDYVGLVELIDEVGFSDHQGVASIIGLMPDKSQFWEQLKICDLRFWSLLAAGSHESALESLHEVAYFLGSNNGWSKKYQSLKFCLEMLVQDAVDTSSSELLFGKELSQWTWNAINQQTVFDDQPLGEAIFNSSEAHCSLMQLYLELQRVKEAFYTKPSLC